MRSTESGFNEEVYLAAAQEQLAAAEVLLEQERYVVAAYLAGVAVELLFLAYLTRAGQPHDAGHSLYGLAGAAGFWDAFDAAHRKRLGDELNEVARRWRNNHRYRSAVAYREFIVRERLYVLEGTRTSREDAMVYSTNILVVAARRLVEAGVEKWN